MNNATQNEDFDEQRLFEDRPPDDRETGPACVVDISGSGEPTVRSDRSTCASLVEHAERIHVFVPPVVSQTTEAPLARERTIHAEPMPLTRAAGAQRSDSDEGRHR